MATDVQEIKSNDEFESLLEETKREKLAVVHFWAEWAPQCQQMNDVILELIKSTELSKVVFAKVVAEDIPDVTTKNGVTSVPSFLFIRDGKVVTILEGANVPEFTKTIKQQLAKVLPPLNHIEPQKQDLNTRLKKLINLAPCMLFMKGTPENAHCGFSKQVLALLKEHNIEFNSFNILNDEEVRQGLKEYSNWPTYPQLYCNGELVGGIDILKELSASGEIDTLFPKKENIKKRLEKLVKQSPVMLFIKGNPSVPKCGFSRTLIAILDEKKVPYETFDILEDEIVRQELKVFSNWPTYPQIYVNGTFIGGLDIIKELNETGELESTMLMRGE